MSLLQITDVKGIGQSSAEILYEHDINTVEELARINIDLLMAIPGFSGIRAAKIISEAQALLSAAEAVTVTQWEEIQPTDRASAAPAASLAAEDAAEKVKRSKKTKKDKQAKKAKDKKKKKLKSEKRKKAEKGKQSKAKEKKTKKK